MSRTLANGPSMQREHVGDADLGRGPGELVAAVAATVAADQPIGAQIRQDVDEKLRRNALRLGQVVGLDHRAFVGGGQLDHRPDGVLRLGRHPHAVNSAIDMGANRTRVHHHRHMTTRVAVAQTPLFPGADAQRERTYGH